jgi:hypothetical protein
VRRPLAGALAPWCLALLLVGCGYTAKTQLPEHVRTVHVEKIKNTIDITGDVTNRQSFQVYRPGLEVDLRNALIDRFVFDGHLKIAPRDRTDALLQGELIDFRRDPLRYNADDSIQEFRVSVSASLRFTDARTGQTLWSAGAISGNATYFLSGRLARTEDEAVAEALEDLARHAVEAILEVW